jgi:hypothetical protein
MVHNHTNGPSSSKTKVQFNIGEALMMKLIMLFLVIKKNKTLVSLILEIFKVQ